MEWPSVLKKPPMYNIPAKKPKRKKSTGTFPNNNRNSLRRSVKRPPIIPNMANSAYLKGNPVTSVTLPFTLPNITN
jgi:hypothetical protein